MEVLAIVGLVGGILIFIMIWDDKRSWNEYLKYYDNMRFRCDRHRWLYKMGLRETHGIAWVVEYGKEFRREKLHL